MNRETTLNKKARTEKRIVDAFFDLYMDRPIDKISIKEIVSIAGCHRSTFYEHFDDIYDLLHKEEAAIFDLQQERILRPILSGELDISNKEVLLPILLNIFNEKGNRIIILIGDHGDPHFEQQFKKNILTTVCKMLNVETSNKERMYLFEFIISGVLAVISRFNVENDISFDELVNYIHPRIIELLTE